MPPRESGSENPDRRGAGPSVIGGGSFGRFLCLAVVAPLAFSSCVARKAYAQSEVPACRIERDRVLLAATRDAALDALAAARDQGVAAPFDSVRVVGLGDSPMPASGNAPWSITLVTDLSIPEVDEHGCRRVQSDGASRPGPPDERWVKGVCLSIRASGGPSPAPPSAPATAIDGPVEVRCSAGALRSLLGNDGELGAYRSPALLFVLAHELGHIVDGDVARAFAPDTRAIALNGSAVAKHTALSDACTAASNARPQEDAADLISTKILKAAAHTEPYASFGVTQRASLTMTVSQIRTLAGRLRDWSQARSEQQGRPLEPFRALEAGRNPTSAVVVDPKLSRDPEFLRWAGKRSICELLQTGTGALLLPAFHGSHPSMVERLMRIADALDAPDGRIAPVPWATEAPIPGKNLSDLIDVVRVSQEQDLRAEAAFLAPFGEAFCALARDHWPANASECAGVSAEPPVRAKEPAEECGWVEGEAHLTSTPLTWERESLTITDGALRLARPIDHVAALNDGTFALAVHEPDQVGILPPSSNELRLARIPCHIALLGSGVAPGEAAAVCHGRAEVVRVLGDRIEPLLVTSAANAEGGFDPDRLAFHWVGAFGGRRLASLAMPNGQGTMVDLSDTRISTVEAWKAPGCSKLESTFEVGAVDRAGVAVTARASVGSLQVARLDPALDTFVGVVAVDPPVDLADVGVQDAPAAVLGCGLVRAATEPRCVDQKGVVFAQLLNDGRRPVAKVRWSVDADGSPAAAAQICGIGPRTWVVSGESNGHPLELFETKDGVATSVQDLRRFERAELRCGTESALLAAVDSQSATIRRLGLQAAPRSP